MRFFTLSYMALWVFSLSFLPKLSFAQVTYSSALNLAETRASMIGYKVVNYKISNLNGTNKKLYWFMCVGASGGACLMSIPETALKVAYSKCVSYYEVTSLAEAYGEIPDYESEEAYTERQNRERIKREKELKEREILKQFNDYIIEGDRHYQQKQPHKSKEFYLLALQLRPNNENALLKLKMAEEVILFLKERLTTIYNLNAINKSLNTYIHSELLTKLKKKIEPLDTTATIHFSVSFFIDTLGNIKHEITNLNLENNRIIEMINSVFSEINIPKQYIKEYPVNCTSNHNFKIELNEYKYTITKTNVNKIITFNPMNLASDIAVKFIPEGPIGQYTIALHQKHINGEEFSTTKLTKFRGTGGPANAILSIFIPGLGDKWVTGGLSPAINKKATITYSLLFAGAVSKIYSNNQYRKYLNEYDPILYEEYYRNANISNKVYNILLPAGVLYWIYDIYWVYKKGMENKQGQKQFIESKGLHLSAAKNNLGLNLTYKF